MVARCNDRESYHTAIEDSDLPLALLRELVRTYEVTAYGYTLIANHFQLLLTAPKHDTPERLAARTPVAADSVTSRSEADTITQQADPARALP